MIAEWYVSTFYSDMSDSDWLTRFARTMPRGSLIADVGCGPGQFARFFRRMGFRVVSIDLSEKMLEVGKQLDSDLVPVAGDIRFLPLKSASIDGLLAAYTLEHVYRVEVDIVLAGIRRVLTSAGSVGFMVKCGEGSYEFGSALAPGESGFVQLWDLDDFSKKLELAGFETLFVDTKAPVSPHEFNHERGFVLARRYSNA